MFYFPPSLTSSFRLHFLFISLPLHFFLLRPASYVSFNEGKPPTSITQIPIATSQTIARIGFQFPYTSSNDPLYTSPPPAPLPPLPPLPQHKDILSSFDFFMLPSDWPIYNRTCKENSTQISPTLSSLLPSSPSLSRIAELLGLLKAENNGM